MATLSIQQTISYAKAAGFTGTALVNIVAIAMAESNLNTTVVNSIGATGILQILLSVHPNVTSAQAMDPAFSFKYAYQLSSGGTNLCAWQSYSSAVCGVGWDNRWSQYVPQVQAAISGGGGGATTLPASGQWFDFAINQENDYATTYKGAGTDTPHYAVDIEAPQDTPFYFLQPGKIVKSDYQAWGGEVFEQPDSGGQEEYVYHLDEIETTIGAHVNAGQVVGLSGGQTSGGSHPTSPQYSSGPHIHFGFFQKYIDSQNGIIPFGQNPNTLISEAKAGGIELTGVAAGDGTATLADSSATPTTNLPTPLSVKVNELLSNFPGFEGIALSLDVAEEFPGVIWYNVGSNAVAAQVPAWIPGAAQINAIAAIDFDPLDYIGAGIRSIMDTFVSNLTPLLFRAVLVAIGFLIVGGLIINAVNGSGSSLLQSVADVADVAEVAA
jgi:murein DD-endopeptidase MepM/ murein hydrolase activator NlpD